MKWSFSQYNSFKKCQRQWYYHYIYASSKAKDKGRQEAFRLSKLINIKAWRGKIVDEVISNYVVRMIKNGVAPDLHAAQKKARIRFNEQRNLGQSAEPVRDGDFRGFLEVEYGIPIDDEVFDNAWNEIDLALQGFYNSTFVWEALKKADMCITQRYIPFSCNEASLIAVPDVICFYPDRNPLIIDWKVQSNPISDYWMQLATYALGLTTCTPHKDWPILPSRITPIDVELAEVQLLTEMVRIHKMKEDDLDELCELIAHSMAEMSLARDGRAFKDLLAEDFSPALNPLTCKYCSFKKICW